eukprot:265327-Pyramimonas_sp.AAC.1
MSRSPLAEIGACFSTPGVFAWVGRPRGPDASRLEKCGSKMGSRVLVVMSSDALLARHPACRAAPWR